MEVVVTMGRKARPALRGTAISYARNAAPRTRRYLSLFLFFNYRPCPLGNPQRTGH
jgi:hypothetical protein